MSRLRLFLLGSCQDRFLRQSKAAVACRQRHVFGSLCKQFLCQWVWWSITARRDWNYQKDEKEKNRAMLEEERRMAHCAANVRNCLSPIGALHLGWKYQSKPAHRGASNEAFFYSSALTGVASMRQKGIAATEAVVCVNSGSLLTVPMNVCERLCRRSFSVTARVFFRVGIVTILFTKRAIFRIFEDLTWNSTPRPSGTCHCSLSLSLRSQ